MLRNQCRSTKFKYEFYSDKQDPEYYFIKFYIIKQTIFNNPKLNNLLYKYKNLRYVKMFFKP